MLAAHTKNLQKQSLRTLSCLLNQRNALLVRRNDPVKLPSFELASVNSWNLFDGARDFSAKSMRSRVELRMQRESGKTLREIRRAKKLRKKLMTDEERLIYNLRRAKKKVALLLQKLKKYELPELPSPRHDPELLTPEQLQAYKKIGFRNKNYVPVGVRGVFGGVVQNMHLHWKFHETVQVCCDNFPKEKIKEMATMIARLSGGIVVNIHNIKTIIMFRGRNYRQPKNLIPINTLTKRKALFKARFEQALESQKLNIKKIEQDLRRKGVNPDDPVAMASIQRVASTFFNAIDKKEGSPYVFRDDKTTQLESEGFQQPEDAGDDSDQEELDRFIAEIEDAADKEWAEEEAAEKEELTQIRYWNRDDIGGRYRRSEGIRNEDSEYENRGGNRNWNNQTHGRAMDDSDDEDEEWESNVIGKMNEASDDDYSEEDFDKSAATIKPEKWQHNKNSRASRNGGLKRNEIEPRRRIRENPKWDSDEGEEQKPRDSRRGLKSGTSAMAKENSTDDNISELDEISQWESDSTSGDESNHR